MRNRRATLSPFMAALTQRSIVENITNGCKSKKWGYWLRLGISRGTLRRAAAFKAITYNQWLLVGRKTFEAMGLSQIESMQLSAAQDR